jgi:Mrp family chromosome partitioning ATPase
MATHSSAIENTALRMNLSATKVPAVTGTLQGRDHHAYAELALKLFCGPDPLRIVVFGATKPGDGVTRTVRGIAAELVRSGKKVAALNGSLRPIPIAGAEIAEPGLSPPSPAFAISDNAQVESKARLIRVGSEYECVLIDCGSLSASLDLIQLAAIGDGVVIVVEAGRTSKKQIHRAAEVIRGAQGKLLGIVLNKRRYPIPAWLYRFLH